MTTVFVVTHDRAGDSRWLAYVFDHADPNQSEAGIARRAGFSKTRFGDWRKGATPGIEIVEKFATAFELDLDDALEASGRPRRRLTRDEASPVAGQILHDFQVAKRTIEQAIEKAFEDAMHNYRNGS